MKSHPITLNGVAMLIWQAAHRAQQDTIIEVEISPNSFADYLRQNDYAPGLKRLVSFSAHQGEVIASGRGLGLGQVAVTNDRPWRLTDLTFVPAGNGRERHNSQWPYLEQH